MSDKFTVEIISPDQTILKQETNEVINEENMAEEPTDNADTPEIEDDNEDESDINGNNDESYNIESGVNEGDEEIVTGQNRDATTCTSTMPHL